MTIYLVTSGCYSDYMVNAVFSTKELASAYIAAHDGRDGYEVEDYELDQGAEMLTKGYKYFTVWMDQEGNTYTDIYDLKRPPDLSKQRSRIDSYSVLARDHEHAVKVANERRTIAIAQGNVTTVKGDK